MKQSTITKESKQVLAKVKERLNLLHAKYRNQQNGRNTI
uniref:Uncharacterized protein n=1 Tax=Arundo donax TaxID=35708 RepID=A0A0A9AC27_ARUDO